MKWGQKVESPFVRKPDMTRAGWREDVDRPGIERYWTGAGWADDIAPRAKPEPAWKGARVIALGILIAIGVVWFIYSVNQPSDVDCSLQRLEYTMGDRAIYEVDDACR